MKRQGGDAMTVALQGGAARRKTRTLGEALDHAWWATLEEFLFLQRRITRFDADQYLRFPHVFPR
ncbi:hypothetical protein XpopCFBP1817_11595 [Xanthomonas populi]|uniref:Uncharacterized protein n=1 Tax=Xanthomonas populi TaxID=53414 RepID=A0A2S7ENA3_9XANT|nr:hypothetical protein XpopCFBP1817_11595 [Xanthomonas populi]